MGPAAGSWSEVDVRAQGEQTVTFTLTTPLGGFLQAATQPIAPAHLLADVPVDALADHPFGTQPVGSGPFALADLTDTTASLVPVVATIDGGDGSDGASPGASGDSLATPGPTRRPEHPVPYLSGIEFTFFDDPEALSAAYRAGDLDAASGLPPARRGQARGRAREPSPALPERHADGRRPRPSTRPPGIRRPGRSDGAPDRRSTGRHWSTRSSPVPQRKRPVRSRPAHRCSMRPQIRPSPTTGPSPGRRSWPPAGCTRTMAGTGPPRARPLSSRS